jgi:Uma2 family endonuclease
MTTAASTMPATFAPPKDRIAWVDDIPILYEDEGQEEMGEANIHVLTDEILHICLRVHIAQCHPDCQVFSNMNLYYRDGPPHPRTGSLPYVSPDNMIVKPYQLLLESVRSYTIGKHGSAPLATAEVLSARSAQQRDLQEKLVVYARLGVKEYIIVDETGEYYADHLVLKRLKKDGTYKDERDADGGVTSKLGFRLVFEPDGLRVINSETGIRYARPMEAEMEARARRLAEERLRLEQEAQQETVAKLKKAEEEIAALKQRLARSKKKKPS